MSIKVMSWVWENGPADGSERFVLLAVADFCDDAGRCWPSMASIARKACLSERGAQKIIRRLEAAGWLSVDFGAAKKGCNEYTVHLLTPEPGSPPNPVHPEPRSPRTPFRVNHSAVTPEPRSPEPSLTVIETPDGVSVPRKAQRRKTSIPENWVPSDRNIADAEARHFSQQEIAHEADRFRDHHLARGNLMRDWDAAWRTWLANARKFGSRGLAGPSGAGGRGPGGSIASIAAWRRATGAV